MIRHSPTRAVRDYVDDPSRTSVAHVGLAHEKLAPHSSDAGKELQPRFIRALAERSPVPLPYASAFRRWVRRTPAGPLRGGSCWSRQVLVATSQGRVLCGLGELTPTENGLSIHHSYGVPYLPGSSLKGVVRAYLRSTQPAGSPWAEGGEHHRDVFGTEADGGAEGGASGVVTFYDALWIPGDKHTPELPWAAEILTPHFGRYYAGGRDDVPPDGTQNPIPVTFLAAQGSFRVVLEGPAELLSHVAALVAHALQEQGVGAKARGGYGRFMVEDCLTPVDEQEAGALKARREAAQAAERLARVVGPEGVLALWRDEGWDESRLKGVAKSWLVTGNSGHPEIDRFERSPEALRALWSWLRSVNLRSSMWDKGVKAKMPEEHSEALQAKTAASGDAAKAATPATSGFGTNHLDRFDDPSSLGKKKRRQWPNTFAIQIAKGEYDEATVWAAIAHLRAHGGKDGHVKRITDAYGVEG